MTHQLELSVLQRDWIEDAIPVVLDHVRGLTSFTSDDLHPILPPAPHLQWYGILVAKLRNQGYLEKLGYRPSKRPECNGRPIVVWKLRP